MLVFSLEKRTNICSEKKYTKRSSVLLLRLVFFFSEQTLIKQLNYYIILTNCQCACVRQCAHTCGCGDFCAIECGRILENVSTNACIKHLERLCAILDFFTIKCLKSILLIKTFFCIFLKICRCVYTLGRKIGVLVRAACLRTNSLDNCIYYSYLFIQIFIQSQLIQSHK